MSNPNQHQSRYYSGLPGNSSSHPNNCFLQNPNESRGTAPSITGVRTPPKAKPRQTTSISIPCILECRHQQTMSSISLI
ncbi:Protein of unknown function [Pyronema omphalodes CBS 100304]|uniref:Uncharacterized protein n=1 Tax=Pyronema omphalodes (strain CBS 100304) TaxID=1076935 RepID=U4KU66_PYROM|nr:Protein of unknown function [Pyronema omphalodes CBS 100304]